MDTKHFHIVQEGQSILPNQVKQVLSSLAYSRDHANEIHSPSSVISELKGQKRIQ